MKKMTVIRKVLVEIVPVCDHTKEDVKWYRNDNWELEDAIEYAKEVTYNAWVMALLYYEYYSEDGELLAEQYIQKIV